MITLRKDKGVKLSIKELDDNFEYLAMDSNDIDLYWDGKTSFDTVNDTLFISGVEVIKNDDETITTIDRLYPKSFISYVDRLGIKIRNYSLIKDKNPELIIERFTKRKGKMPTKFKIVNPYSDEVYSKELEDITGNGYIFRPMIIPITSESDYYRIYAENYFSAINPPKVSGGRNSFYKSSQKSQVLYDDTESFSKDIPTSQEGTTYCRLSIRISDGLDGYIYSKPLKEFKIIMRMQFINSRITYGL